MLNRQNTCAIIENKGFTGKEVAKKWQIWKNKESGEMMLDSMLKSVTDAESKADKIIKDAEQQAASILENARHEAKVYEEETVQKIRLRNQETSEAMQLAGDQRMKAAEVKAAEEVSELRRAVEPKRKEAADAVISILI